MLRGDLGRDGGVECVCVDLIDLERANVALFIIDVYSLKRLACVTFPEFFEEKKEKTKYI